MMVEIFLRGLNAGCSSSWLYSSYYFYGDSWGDDLFCCYSAYVSSLFYSQEIPLICPESFVARDVLSL